MSEYQYYEFQAVDRPLTGKQMDTLHQYSSRAQVTPSSFVVAYNYGSFRGNPKKLIDEYFDAFLYIANWGTRWFMLRVPRKLLGAETAATFNAGDCLSSRDRGEHVVLSFRSEDEEGCGWEEEEGWLAPLIPIRGALMRGDHRALYLGWLLAVQAKNVDDDALEPAVPAGLAELDGPLDQLAEFLRIDSDLIAAAAEQSAAQPNTSLSSREVTAWISKLPIGEKDALLARLIADDELHLVIELQRQVLDSAFGPASSSAEPRRTAAKLLERARILGDARKAKEAADRARKKASREREAAKMRKKHVESLVGKESTLWTQVHQLIDTRQPKRYDEAVSLLQDLHDLAELKRDEASFRIKMSALRTKHEKKSSLVVRFRKAKLLDGP
jgi:hypothetical protein